MFRGIHSGTNKACLGLRCYTHPTPTPRETLPLFPVKLPVEVVHATRRCDPAEFTAASVRRDLVLTFEHRILVVRKPTDGPAARSIQFTPYDGLKQANVHTNCFYERLMMMNFV